MMHVFLILLPLLASLTFSTVASASNPYDIIKCQKISPADLLDHYDVIFTGKAGHTFSIKAGLEQRDPLRAGYSYAPLHHATIVVDQVYKGNVGETATVQYTSYYPFVDEPGTPEHAAKALYYKRNYLILANNTGIKNTYFMDGCKVTHYDLDGVKVNSALYSILPPEDVDFLKNKFAQKQKKARMKILVPVALFLIVIMALVLIGIRSTPKHLQNASTSDDTGHTDNETQ